MPSRSSCPQTRRMPALALSRHGTQKALVQSSKSPLLQSMSTSSLPASVVKAGRPVNLPRGQSGVAQKLLDDTARNVRLLHILYWAGLDASLSSLRTTEGLERLVQRGVLTEREERTLIASGARPTKRHEVVLQWILVRMRMGGCGTGKEGGAMSGAPPVLGNLIGTCKELRGVCGTVPDQKVERMPLAYIHIVHIMIDLLLVLGACTGF